MADVREELRFQLVKLGQFLALTGDFALVLLFRGNVPTFSGDEKDVALLVFYGRPSTSESLIPTASKATLLISSTVPCASRSPTN